MPAVLIGHLRKVARFRAKQAHTMWMHNAIKPNDGLLRWERDRYIYTTTVQGKEALHYRFWTVELQMNGSIIRAYNQHQARKGS